MAKFNYKAIRPDGKMKEGVLEGSSRAVVKAQLVRMRLRVLSIKLDKSSLGDSDDGITPIIGNMIYRDGNGDVQIELGRKGPTSKHIIIFSKQLSTMINSGVPLIQALTILGGQQQSQIFATIIKKVRTSVENGSTFSDALAEYPKIFDNLYVAMVRAGEASGSLDVILTKLVTYIEKAEKIKGQVKSAMMYPIIVISVAILVITGLLLFVVPTFAEQYADSGRKLPALTQIVIDFSNWIATNWMYVFGAIVLGIFSLRLYIKTEKGRKNFDRLLLKAPGLGVLLKKIAVGRFCSTMASMLNSGVNLLEALDICAASAGNVIIEKFVLNVSNQLEKGAKLSEPLGEGNLFPEMVVSMVAVGEATGALDEMLAKVSDFYEEEVDLAVQTMLSMIEPIMIVGIGGVVGFIVIAMYLPVFEMAGGIG
ncbi:MAG: type II secretion system F family protein [Bdellovibrionota bacterium]